jgi:hypothetical protein
VAEDQRVGAAGVLEGVGEEGEVVESAIIVDRLRQLRDGAAAPRPIGRSGEKWVAEDVGEQDSLRRELVHLFVESAGASRCVGNHPRKPIGILDVELWSVAQAAARAAAAVSGVAPPRAGEEAACDSSRNAVAAR